MILRSRTLLRDKVAISGAWDIASMRPRNRNVNLSRMAWVCMLLHSVYDQSDSDSVHAQFG